MFRRTYTRPARFVVTLVTAEEELSMVAFVSGLLVLVVLLVPTGVTAAPGGLLAINVACFLLGLAVGCCCHRIRR
jgi:hypothetical protein